MGKKSIIHLNGLDELKQFMDALEKKGIYDSYSFEDYKNVYQNNGFDNNHPIELSNIDLNDGKSQYWTYDTDVDTFAKEDFLTFKEAMRILESFISNTVIESIPW